MRRPARNATGVGNVHSSYAEILDDSAVESRSRESRAMRLSITAMEEADADRVNNVKRSTEIYTVSRLWSALLEDIASPQNAYPAELKAQIISIGIFILRECEALRRDTRRDFETLTEICRIIEKGLA